MRKATKKGPKVGMMKAPKAIKVSIKKNEPRVSTRAQGIKAVKEPKGEKMPVVSKIVAAMKLRRSSVKDANRRTRNKGRS